MPRINWTRVILGGLLAGVIINAIEAVVSGMILGERFEAQLGREIGGNAIAMFVVWCFLIGIMSIWVYAAIRAHYGAGPKTAVIAAVMVWVIGYALPNFSLVALGVFGPRLMALASAIGLVEIILATVAGAWVYKPAEVVSIQPGVAA